MCLILQHPHAPVNFDPVPPDPREQPVLSPAQAALGVTQQSLESSAIAQRVEREVARRQLANLKPEERRRLEAVQKLRGLCNEWGHQRVIRWAKNLAAEAGVEL